MTDEEYKKIKVETIDFGKIGHEISLLDLSSCIGALSALLIGKGLVQEDVIALVELRKALVFSLGQVSE
jgi:hypothetical protein